MHSQIEVGRWADDALQIVFNKGLLQLLLSVLIVFLVDERSNELPEKPRLSGMRCHWQLCMVCQSDVYGYTR